jgi:hypothetical protein
MSKSLLFVLLAVAFGGSALAKLPAPTLDDAAKAKAAETAAKTAWQAKVDAWQLCRSQDRIAAKFGGKSAVKPVSTTATAAPPAAPATPPAAPSAAAASKPAAPATAAASAPAGTPVAAAPPAPCADPGPFAFNAPAQTPLETSGAHSPAGNAASPPSVKQDSATMAPAAKK